MEIRAVVIRGEGCGTRSTGRRGLYSGDGWVPAELKPPCVLTLSTPLSWLRCIAGDAVVKTEGPVAKTPPQNAVDSDSIRGRGAKVTQV